MLLINHVRFATCIRLCDAESTYVLHHILQYMMQNQRTRSHSVIPLKCICFATWIGLCDAELMYAREQTWYGLVLMMSMARCTLSAPLTLSVQCLSGPRHADVDKLGILLIPYAPLTLSGLCPTSCFVMRNCWMRNCCTRSRSAELINRICYASHVKLCGAESMCACVLLPLALGCTINVCT